MLAYGASADQVDEIARMGKSTILETLMRFCGAVESLYTAEYLRKPTNEDLQRLLKKGEMRGFPGMIGSIELYALDVEKLSKCMAGRIWGQKRSKIYHFGGSGIF